MHIKFIYYNFMIILYNLYSRFLTSISHKLLSKNALIYDKLRIYGSKRDLILKAEHSRTLNNFKKRGE